MCCVDRTATEPGSESGRGSWRLMSQRGPEGKSVHGDKGARGERGLTGDAGVGILDIAYSDKALVFALSDGTVKRFDL